MKTRYLTETMKQLSLIFLMVILMFSAASAQKERKEVREGNDNYEKGKYGDAETSYRKALEKKCQFISRQL